MKRLLPAVLTMVLAFVTAVSWGGTTRIKIVQARPGGVPAEWGGDVTFFCSANYNSQRCLKDLHQLVSMLTEYPIAKLGGWQFVIASEEGWKKTIRELGGDPDSPAFSVLGERVTVFEETLFEANAAERRELLERFKLPLDRLLDYAVTHELAHALCGERNESRAERIGSDLRSGSTARCDVEAVESRNRGGGPPRQ